MPSAIPLSCHARLYRYGFLVCATIVAFSCLSTEAWARSHAPHHHKKHHRAHAVVDRSAAYADIVIDAETGEILHATNPDSIRHPASLTKMMTLYLTFQALEKGRISLNQYLPVSANAAEQAPTKLGLRTGQRIRVEDALLGVVTESANDAAMVLGEWLGGNESNFAAMMTRQARALGMTRTVFQNPNGLPDPDQVTTARDMAVLGQALIDHFPRFYGYFSHTNFVYNGANHPNHNHLMSRYDGMDGIKTGYIRASGFNLVASAKRGDTRLIGVVFGGKSATARDNRMALLLDECFKTSQENREEDRTASTRVAKAPEPADQNSASDDDQAIADDANKDDYVTLPKPTLPPPAKHVTASPVPRSTEISGDNWGVQIGAYASQQAAQAALASLVQAMPQLLGSARPVTEPVMAGHIRMVRARLMGIDPKTAQTVCATMIQNKHSCLTVGP